MQAFLRQVAEYLEQNYKEKLDELCIVLPNKRGALFLKHHLGSVYQRTIWLPSIISAEEFIGELSGTQNIEDIDLTCRLYESYKSVYGDKAEPFESFVKWGNLILQDFNEIDRYLVDAAALYLNLRDIKEIENWSLGEDDLSPFQENYLNFMSHLGQVYEHFTASLLEKNESYQGLAYKEAVSHFEESPYLKRFKKIIFCGFNALNSAETIIFSKLCESGRAEMLWDADRYYLDNKVQEAGSFLRRNFKTFPAKNASFIGEHFKTPKKIDIISVPKQMGQGITVRKLVEELLENGTAPDSIAIVLANEKLLWPVLRMLPDSVKHVNITMEYPIKYTAAFNCIDLLIKIQAGYQVQNKKQKHIYYQDFLNLLRYPFFREYLTIRKISQTDAVINQVMERNYAFITEQLLEDLFAGSYDTISSLFKPWKNSQEATESIMQLLLAIKEHHITSELNANKSLELEYLEVLIRNFNRLAEFVGKYDYFASLKTFKTLFNQVVGSSSAAFVGEPLRGLQIMGVLETRTLDFENLIFVSVNEGVLPSGKSQNSFIPNDVKRYFGMPLYGDKDAIYAYHFYRLLQRAKKCFITYDSETDTFGKGEKSRFVSQLESELTVYNPEIKITESVALSNSFGSHSEAEITIQKTDDTLAPVLKKAISNEIYQALSPSSLIVFKDCSLKFYFRYAAGIKEPAALEESAEANTFGSILHESLESLYTPYTNRVLAGRDLDEMKKNVSATVEEKFLNYFSRTEAFMGKNLLQQNVLKVYAEKMIDLDRNSVVKHKEQPLTIVALEKEMAASLEVTINGKNETVFIRGTTDRIDRIQDSLRIIDYKSSIRSEDKFEFAGFELLFNDKAYDKMLQLFLYAWMANKNKIGRAAELAPCIVPFKKFEQEPRYILSAKQPLQFSEELLSEFEEHLKLFIAQIFNREKPFLQIENDEQVCGYCAYNAICRRN